MSSVVVSTKGSVLDKSLSDIIKESKKTATKPKPKGKPAAAATKPRPGAAAGAKPKPRPRPTTSAAATKPAAKKAATSTSTSSSATARKQQHETYVPPAARQRRLPGRGKDDADTRRRESLEKFTLASSKAKRQDAISKARGLAPSKAPPPKRSDFTTAPTGVPKKATKPEKIQITIQNDVVAPAASAKPKAPKPRAAPAAAAAATTVLAVKPRVAATTQAVRAAPKPKAIKTTAGGIVQPDPKNFERQKELVKKARGAETASIVTKKAAPTLSQRFASR